MITRLPMVVGLAVTAVLVSGCGSSQDADVRDAATKFYDAVAAKNGRAACAQLSGRTSSEVAKSAKKPCPKAILEEAIPKVGTPEKVEAFGTMSKITYAGESAFLSRFSDGWRVVAAGCQPKPGQPYDCEIQGG